jgi:Big-like domain-containing protein
VQFGMDGVNLGTEVAADPFDASWNTATLANGEHILTATARDAAGNQRTVSVTVVVANDTTPPNVAINGPSDGAAVDGTVVVTADAQDDIAVVALQFAIDGVSVGDEVTSAPFELQWNTTTASDGVHVLSAIARDAAGNQGASTQVTITVAHAETQP